MVVVVFIIEIFDFPPKYFDGGDADHCPRSLSISCLAYKEDVTLTGAGPPLQYTVLYSEKHDR